MEKAQNKKKDKKFFDKLKDQYRLIIYNDTTFQSVWSIKVSRLKALTYTSLFSAIIIILVILLIATTGLREYIPGYPKAEYRQMLVRTALQIDSLEYELKTRDDFFNSIKAVIDGEIPDNSRLIDSASATYNIEIAEYNHDSVFQDELLAEQLSLSLRSNETSATELGQIHFFVPVKGVVTNNFNAITDHFGVDLVSGPNSRIFSVLNGTVIFSGWTLETGYVIYIQHESNIISAYKHNSELLKSAGDRVNEGEAIAIIGNSGELTTGPHLHFELWHGGKAINPEQYIDF
ncbi:MAG: M23 family metallopeptidase [Bacteroidales bacterium]|nr:M23 family metallopeptidase [Bacteroidales bacterium]